LHVALVGLQQCLAGVAARGRAMGEQQAHAWDVLAQGLHQGGGGTGLTQRHGMHPHHRAIACHLPISAQMSGLPLLAVGRVVPAQPLPPHGAVQRLLLTA